MIWEHKTGETDRVITLLTPEGILSAYARGSLRPGGKLTSATAMLGYSNFELAEGRSMYTVADAMSIRRFTKLSTDMSAYALAAYFCELAKLLAPSDDGAAAFLSLMLNSIYLLGESEKPRELIKCVFELRAMTYAGYRPDVDSCAACSGSGSRGVYFDVAAGNFLCADCAARRGLPINVPGSVICAMRYICESESAKAFSFEISAAALKILSRVCEEYVRRWVDHPLQTLDFYNTQCK